MYEKFGFDRQEDGSYEFRLFVPDSAVDRMQYVRAGPCRIVEVRVVGDFQDQVEKGRLMDIVLQHAYAFSGSTEGGALSLALAADRRFSFHWQVLGLQRLRPASGLP